MISIREGEKVMSSKVAICGGIGILILVGAFCLTLGPPASHQEVDQTPASVIVQGDDLDTVRDAVLEVGGEITHELQIISAVGANLTPAQVERLNKTSLVRIHENRSVTSSANEAEPDVRDKFKDVAWSGNNGAMYWSGDWNEDDAEGAGPAAGNIQVVSSEELRMCDNPNTDTLPGVSRTVDLSNGIEAEFSFDYRTTQGVDTSDCISVEVSADGGVTWTILELIDDLAGECDGDREYDITAYMSANTTIRFRVYNLYGGSDEYFFIDDVRIKMLLGYTPNLDHATVVAADQLHQLGITGAGVAVGVLDTGFWHVAPLMLNKDGLNRVISYYDAINDVIISGVNSPDSDYNGHGAHITSTLASSAQSPDGSYHGIAPDATLVPIKAFDQNGSGTYLDVIRGIDFAVRYNERLGLRVLNCSFSAPPVSLYWDDPLAQAVMAAWDAGIVVVASAGNRGPEPMTIGVPGNVPYVITVGAVSDNLTPTDDTEDYLTSFSSTGPTAEGFVKPEVVAPGGHIVAMMPADAKIALEHPEFHDGGDYFMMSGTSQATAIVSGVVALMLQDNPSLSPDDVKSRLIDTARPAVDGSATPAYSVLQQGAGVVNAYDAAYSTASGIANLGLDVANELAGIEHYGGPVNQLDDGSFYIMEHAGVNDGTTWDGSYNWIDAYLWSDGQSLAYLWSDAFGQAYLWSDGQGLAYLWSDSQQFAYLWSDGQGLAYLWSDTLTEIMSINCWVPQE